MRNHLDQFYTVLVPVLLMVTLFLLHLFSHIPFVLSPKTNQAFHQYELTVMWLQLMLLLIDLQLLTNYYAAKCGWDCHNAQNKLPKLNTIVRSTEMISSELEPYLSFCVRTISNLHSNVSIHLSLHQPYWRLHVTALALSLDFAHVPIQLYQESLMMVVSVFASIAGTLAGTQ